jgi:cell wall-associated NlpC family hydrolase
VATPHAFRTHALDQFRSDHPGLLTARRLRSGLVIGATSVALTFTVLPGAAAAPGEATTPEQATQMVAEASHDLEIVTEQLNTAKVQLDEQQAAADKAEQAVLDAQAQLDALDGQIRQIARSAYTGDGLTQIDVLLTSDSAEDFLSQLGTLDAIAGHTNDVLTEVSAAAEAADAARTEADAAAAAAKKTYDEIAAQQADLEAQIADYQEQYEALTAAQRTAVNTAHAGQAVSSPVPSGIVAPSQAAQVAVDTALAQVGDPYVWGAGGPDAFDCSGLTQYSYSAAGVALPHSSSMQSGMGVPVSVSDLQPGDLLFYYSPVSHVAMYIGNGQMVHASTSGTPVQVVSFNSMSGFSFARRIAG